MSLDVRIGLGRYTPSRGRQLLFLSHRKELSCVLQYDLTSQLSQDLTRLVRKYMGCFSFQNHRKYIYKYSA